MSKQNKRNKIVTVIGHKGFGKTTLTEILAIARDQPTIFIDPRAQYGEAPYRRHFKSFSHLQRWLKTARNFSLWKRYKLELVVSIMDDEDFQNFIEMAFKATNFTLVIDEIDMFAGARISRKSALFHIINYGRHNEIDVIVTARRPADIPRSLTSQTDHFFLSKVREPNDLKYFKDYIGEARVNRLLDMERYSFLVLDENYNASELHVTKRLAYSV